MGRVARTFSRVGRRLPAHAGAPGKALLAERPNDQLPLPEDELERLVPNTHADRADLAATRERGYAVDREEGVLGIAEDVAGAPPQTPRLKRRRGLISGLRPGPRSSNAGGAGKSSSSGD